MSTQPPPGIINPAIQCGYNSFLQCVRAMGMISYLNKYLAIKQKDDRFYGFVKRLSKALISLTKSVEEQNKNPISCPVENALRDTSKYFEEIGSVFYNTGLLEVYEIFPDTISKADAVITKIKEESPIKLFINSLNATNDEYTKIDKTLTENYTLVCEFWHTGGYHFVARVKYSDKWYIYSDRQVYEQGTSEYNTEYATLKTNGKIECAGYVRRVLSEKNKADNFKFMSQQPVSSSMSQQTYTDEQLARLQELKLKDPRDLDENEKFEYVLLKSMTHKGGKSLKKTTEKKHILGRERVIYKGAYGKKYIKSKGHFIAVSTLK